MKCFMLLAAAVAMTSAGVVPLPTLVRAPAYDSAFIKSERFGGNFAYKTIESHAYALHTPIVQHLAIPISVAYSSAPAFTYTAPDVYTAVAMPQPVAPEAESVPKNAEAEEAVAPVAEETVAPEEPQPTAENPEAPLAAEEQPAASTDSPATNNVASSEVEQEV